ncbi:MAG: magnesium-translocating P-type ATPase [Clostridiales bacterium]|nr:magnesium-translocating P-type ATPase [Clostridiales bacterium]
MLSKFINNLRRYKSMKKNIELKKKILADYISEDVAKDRLLYAAGNDEKTLFDKFGWSIYGLTEKQIENSKKEYGSNVFIRNNNNSLFKKICGAFINPFTIVLFILALVSAVTDIVLADSGDKDCTTVAIIITMVLISGILRFVQETRSSNAAQKLQKMVNITSCIQRANSAKKEISTNEIVVGDIIHLSTGDLVPADVRILSATDLFVDQSALTGESEPIEKTGNVYCLENDTLTDINNLAFMGSTVISGSAKAVAVAVGKDTVFGSLAKTLNEKPAQTEFEKGVNSVSWVLIRFMLIMVPVVFFINGFTKGDWMDALLFAISIAVGLTPEMLPMIVTTCLAKGAVTMSKKKTIVKNLNAIQNFGAIDILCTDKTGTLTQNDVVLEYHLNVDGQEDIRVLRHAYLNSYFQTGYKNLMDIAIINKTEEEESKNTQLLDLSKNYIKIDEIPFDFTRRRLTTVVKDKQGKIQMVTKGAAEEMLAVCTYAECNGTVKPLTEDVCQQILNIVDSLNDNGFRVLVIAQKSYQSANEAFTAEDECDMVLLGYLAFLDPVKETSASALKALKARGVKTKILTGDNERVTRTVCKKVGLKIKNMLLGSDLDMMSDSQLSKVIEKTDVFAKLTPEQKSRVVSLLRKNGHTVGFLGDGINDAAAMKSADVGISVDSAVDVAKESADIILLKKDLTVLEEGIIEGRKTYANIIKYIKITASSNFGNMFSVLAASAFLPFLPMESLHLIILNLIYDISCTAIPWDNVDKEFLSTPRRWDASSVSKFMLWIGPTSSVFDIITYLLMYFVICPIVCGGQMYSQITDSSALSLFISVFQAGWFVESMWSQTLVIHMIRTPKIPFIQSRASLPVTILSFAGIGILTVIPFTSFGAAIGFSPLPLTYFIFLLIIIVCYMILATVMKKTYIKKYGELL